MELSSTAENQTMKFNIQKLLGSITGITLITTSIATSIQPANAVWNPSQLGRHLEHNVGNGLRQIRDSVNKNCLPLEGVIDNELRRERRSSSKVPICRLPLPSCAFPTRRRIPIWQDFSPRDKERILQRVRPALRTLSLFCHLR